MVVPFGNALERRSRTTTYRPTVTPEESTHVNTFTGTTSSFSRTAAENVTVAAAVRKRVKASSRLAKARPKTTVTNVPGFFA
ncbi:hypothetical protein [Streptomyces antibioticus]|uniref:Uncharacterized protein n=1 Tax=Streptomyces antibioticus TaxID=1890 RepID=A0AAE6Y3K4_STRAT|nr:hypothetical protein [Streptomyces antibioticus]QIT42226.1 hypothetical protein HCX60_00695 [Streptomyces antibioticus]